VAREPDIAEACFNRCHLNLGRLSLRCLRRKGRSPLRNGRPQERAPKLRADQQGRLLEGRGPRVQEVHGEGPGEHPVHRSGLVWRRGINLAIHTFTCFKNTYQTPFMLHLFENHVYPLISNRCRNNLISQEYELLFTHNVHKMFAGFQMQVYVATCDMLTENTEYFK